MDQWMGVLTIYHFGDELTRAAGGTRSWILSIHWLLLPVGVCFTLRKCGLLCSLIIHRENGTTRHSSQKLPQQKVKLPERFIIRKILSNVKLVVRLVLHPFVKDIVRELILILDIKHYFYMFPSYFNFFSLIFL